MKPRLRPYIKKAINVIAAILLMSIIIMNTVQNKELKDKNGILIENINAKEDIINGLTADNENLNTNIAQLEGENSNLHENNKLLKLEVQELLAEIEKNKKENSQTNNNNNSNNTSSTRKDFKCFMPYDAITSKSSMQWKLQQQATTNEDGIRCIDGVPMVAVGTGWGLRVGDIAIVTCENGNRFKVMVGDIKANKHTDAENKTTIFNGCRCEFIVDKDALDPMVRKMGNIATLDKYKGYVVDIQKA